MGLSSTSDDRYYQIWAEKTIENLRKDRQLSLSAVDLDHDGNEVPSNSERDQALGKWKTETGFLNLETFAGYVMDTLDTFAMCSLKFQSMEAVRPS